MRYFKKLRSIGAYIRCIRTLHFGCPGIPHWVAFGTLYNPIMIIIGISLSLSLSLKSSATRLLAYWPCLWQYHTWPGVPRVPEISIVHQTDETVVVRVPTWMASCTSRS